MKNIALFSIPAHGHTNPMLPVAAELVKRGNNVRFYSFNEFGEKIKATGAEFISCDNLLPEISAEQEKNLKEISTTEMTIQDIRCTLAMDEFLDNEFKTFNPDVVYTDSVCFWGKLNAGKHNVPMVVSTSTFAFNMLSSKYMKNSGKEIADMIFGLPKIAKELKTLEPYGYKVKSPLELVQSDNKTDSIVYTSRRFQPYAESFSDHYIFVGPSVFSKVEPKKNEERPLVYISMGTIINDRPDFYHKCMDALKDMNVEVIISCGNSIDIKKLGELPENVKAYPYVNQLDILSKASAFISHCGMNSVSESLYMAAPIVLYPQTNEQRAVARRVKEIGAGVMLEDDSVEGIKNAVKEIIDNKSYKENAEKCCNDFRSCPGTEGAAEFIENAPHKSNGVDVIKSLKIANGLFTFIYWLVITSAILLVGFFVSWQFFWIIGLCAGILSYPIIQLAQKIIYKQLVKKIK